MPTDAGLTDEYFIMRKVPDMGYWELWSGQPRDYSACLKAIGQSAGQFMFVKVSTDIFRVESETSFVIKKAGKVIA